MPQPSARPDRVPQPEPEQLALFDWDLEAITVDRVAHWYSQLLNVATASALTYVNGEVAKFVTWNLARMGPKHHHDLSATQIAERTAWKYKRVGQLRAESERLGWLTISRSRGRNSTTLPGPFTMLLQTPATAADVESETAGLRLDHAPAPEHAGNGTAHATAAKAAAKANRDGIRQTVAEAPFMALEQ